MRVGATIDPKYMDMLRSMYNKISVAQILSPNL
jgi:hypothetical protein